MKKEKALILSLGIVGALADYATTQIGLKMGLTEINPLANPLLEGAFAVSGSLIIDEIGKKLEVSRSLRNSLMLVPATLPLIVATHNLILILTVNAGKYPISEFPLLYPIVG